MGRLKLKHFGLKRALILILCLPFVLSSACMRVNTDIAEYEAESESFSSFENIADFPSVSLSSEFPSSSNAPDISSAGSVSDIVSSLIEQSKEITAVMAAKPTSDSQKNTGTSAPTDVQQNQDSQNNADNTPTANNNSTQAEASPPAAQPQNGQSQVSQAQTSPSQVAPSVPSSSTGEIRAIWFSYLDWGIFLNSKSKDDFTREIKTVLDNISYIGVNTLIIHAVAFGDAFYESAYFPWASRVNGKIGKSPGYDPFLIITEEAKKKNISVHAWINPMRTFNDSQMAEVSDSYQVKKWYNSSNRLNYMVKSNNGHWVLNPASAEVRAFIANGAAEITKKYDIDAIHIDDYFYPDSWDKSQDKNSYNSYKNGGGTLSIDDWRRSNTEALVKEMYKAMKKEDSNALFGISPAGNRSYNYNTMYADVDSWCKNPSGIMDYVAPQIYWEFNHATAPFQRTADEWNSLCKNSKLKLCIGLAAYKIGDSSYGTEWKSRTDMMKSQINASRGLSEYNGYALFDYKSFFNPAASVSAAISKEIENIKALFV